MRRPHRVRGLAVAAMLLGWASCLRPEPETSADGAVRAQLIRYYDALSARDWERLPTSFWPNATLTTIWRPPDEPEQRVWTTTVPAFIAAAPEGPDSQPIFEERPVSMEVRVDGRLASAWVRYRARFGSPDALACWTGTDLFTLIRQDREWRIVSIAYDGDEGSDAARDCG